MNNYMCIHTFTSEEARREYLTPPEKRDPPEKRLTEKEWASLATQQKPRASKNGWETRSFFSAIGTRKAPTLFLNSWAYLVIQV